MVYEKQQKYYDHYAKEEKGFWCEGRAWFQLGFSKLYSDAGRWRKDTVEFLSSSLALTFLVILASMVGCYMLAMQFFSVILSSFK